MPDGGRTEVAWRLAGGGARAGVSLPGGWRCASRLDFAQVGWSWLGWAGLRSGGPDGGRWIGRHPCLRLAPGYAAATDLFFGAIYFMVIASAQNNGMNTGLIGVMAACWAPSPRPCSCVS
ncbi:hypothetical protein [Streptomyces sp. G-G2]|uniref:hypothetical protein n=1 Tax=Streptomyces sp. G-G2 TaxID=3046201 RepID=UPI0024BA126B|nr:hypothetical protein [Streptomyces sp. G-G2]MDJ0383707.1 hypothetical protein [Streptomyces sp. G-G2]